MRWPWTSKARLDDALARLAAVERVNAQLLEQAAADRRDAQKRYETLVQATVTMRREGLEVVAPPVDHEPPKDPLDPSVRTAIEELTEQRSPARRHMIEVAMGLTREGRDPKEIAELVRKGEDVTL